MPRRKYLAFRQGVINLSGYNDRILDAIRRDNEIRVYAKQQVALIFFDIPYIQPSVLFLPISGT